MNTSSRISLIVFVTVVAIVIACMVGTGLLPATATALVSVGVTAAIIAPVAFITMIITTIGLRRTSRR